MLSCAPTASSSTVSTFIPSATGVAQAGSSLFCPSTLTRHMRQTATDAIPGW
jgi:hypothetical protein